MRSTAKIKQKIHNLTKDDDDRQELWLHYVSGNSPSTFEQKLLKIKRKREQEEKFLCAISEFYINPPSKKTLKLLETFSEFERSIMFLLLLGFTVQEVSEYKGISYIRIKQSIASIKTHTIWKDYGLKERL